MGTVKKRLVETRNSFQQFTIIVDQTCEKFRNGRLGTGSVYHYLSVSVHQHTVRPVLGYAKQQRYISI